MDTSWSGDGVYHGRMLDETRDIIHIVNGYDLARIAPPRRTTEVAGGVRRTLLSRLLRELPWPADAPPIARRFRIYWRGFWT